jgi:adenosylcobinamide-GDP ribazoletransferase
LRFLTALRFLTIIPLPKLREVSGKDVGRSLVYFPIVGIIIGLILAGLAWVLTLILPMAVVSILLIIALVLIIGGLHLDGLADTFDGLAGHTVEERWQIMRDSHIGSFGVVAIVCLLLLEYGSLISIPRAWLFWSLILMPTAGRWAIVYAITVYPYARPSGLGTVFKENAGRWSLIIASVVTLAVAGGLFFWAGLVIMAVVWGITAGVGAFFKRRFAGLTGDNYGAINVIVEVTVLVVVVLLSHMHWLLR